MLNAQLGWLNDYSEYIDLRREMAFAKTYGRLGWQWLWCNKTQQKHQNTAQWQIEWNTNAAYFHNNSKRIVMPYAIMDKQITQLVNNIYATKTLATQCTVYHQPKQWKGVGVFLKTAFAYSHSALLHQVETNVAMGVTF